VATIMQGPAPAARLGKFAENLTTTYVSTEAHVRFYNWSFAKLL